MVGNTEVQEIALEVLKKYAANLGFKSVRATGEIDYDGAPVMVVDAHYEGAPVEDFALLRTMRDKIQNELILRGDDRAVFVRNHYPEDLTEIDEDIDLDADEPRH